MATRSSSLKGLKLVASKKQDVQPEAGGQRIVLFIKSYFVLFLCFFLFLNNEHAFFCASILQHKTYYILLCSTGGYISLFVWVKKKNSLYWHYNVDLAINFLKSFSKTEML